MTPILIVSCVCALVCGYCLSLEWQGRRESRMRRRGMQKALRDREGETAPLPSECRGMARRILVFAQDESLRCMAGRAPSFLSSKWIRARGANLAAMIRPAGLDGVATEEGLVSARLKTLVGCSLIGFAGGALFSTGLAVILGFTGLLFGYFSIGWALRKEIAARSDSVERHLSEMIEVMSLGLRSGMSFERSFALYAQYFDTGLSRATAQVAEQWTMGLISREEALRDLGKGYESPLFSRVIESMVRSLRFGTSIADALESSAAEARALHKARMEERIAKAPVKMMLPVGTLVLPAMLLLVLGPVLLELVAGI